MRARHHFENGARFAVAAHGTQRAGLELERQRRHGPVGVEVRHLAHRLEGRGREEIVDLGGEHRAAAGHRHCADDRAVRLQPRDRGPRPNISDTSPFKADWTKHKTFDGSCPLGPWIVPASDIGDPQNLGLKLWVNDVLKQDSNSKDMIFNLAEQIAQLSSGMTLHPGDLVLTGTPAGVGSARGEFLKPGDVVKIWIEKIGTLTNKMA